MSSLFEHCYHAGFEAASLLFADGMYDALWLGEEVYGGLARR